MSTYAAQISSSTGERSFRSGKGRQILGLDLIRFAAALLVLGYHLGFVEAMQTQANTGHVLDAVLCNGWVGVDIFFCLSGFVIAYSANGSTPLRFVESRFLRLYPAVWICSSLTLLGLLSVQGFHPYLIRVWLNSLALAPQGTLIDPSYWTLSIEMGFYLLVFLLFSAGLFRYIGGILTAVAAISTTGLACEYAVQHGSLAAGPHTLAFLAFLESRWGQICLLQQRALFALGVLLWLALFQRLTELRACALGLCLVGCMLAIRGDWQKACTFTKTALSPLAAFVLWSVALAGIILSVTHNDQVLKIAGIRGTILARTLGLMTYPVYLLHQQLGRILMQRVLVHMPAMVAFLLTSVLALACGFAVVRFAELPLRARLKHMLLALRSTGTEPAASLP